MSFLHYVTYKYIVIKDKRLGVAYYSLAIVIVLYTFGQIVINKAYLQFDTAPRGNLRILTNSPPLKKHEHFLESESHRYCCNSSSQVPASPKSGKKKSAKVSCLACRKFDGLSLNWPVESKAVTIATLIKERWEITGQDENDGEKFIVQREDAFFTLNPEHALLKIEHSISALSSSDDPFAASHRMMHGWLVNYQGKKVRSMNSNNFSKVDKIRVAELLQAAGIKSLGDPSDALNAQERTYRENGVVLHVTIEYKNADKTWFGTGRATLEISSYGAGKREDNKITRLAGKTSSTTEYSYHVRRVPYSDYRVKQEVPIIDSTRFENGFDKDMQVKKRLVSKRYCTRIEFIQAGKIGQFSLSNLIIQLISGMGLLTITATIIDAIALYISPMRTMYRQYVYELSPELEHKVKHILQKEEKEVSMKPEQEVEGESLGSDILPKPHDQEEIETTFQETDKKND